MRWMYPCVEFDPKPAAGNSIWLTGSGMSLDRMLDAVRYHSRLEQVESRICETGSRCGKAGRENEVVTRSMILELTGQGRGIRRDGRSGRNSFWLSVLSVVFAEEARRFADGPCRASCSNKTPTALCPLVD